LHGCRMYSAVPCEFVLEDPNAPANIQVREVGGAPFPRVCQHGVQQPTSGAARAALAVSAQVLACPPSVEHAVVVLTLTARHGWSLPLNTVDVDEHRPEGAGGSTHEATWHPVIARICAGLLGWPAGANWPLWLASSSGPGIYPVLSRCVCVSMIQTLAH